ncbi:hypothetical protein VTO42DRAFT_4078 [Malbranchea cinnamomea]
MPYTSPGQRADMDLWAASVELAPGFCSKVIWTRDRDRTAPRPSAGWVPTPRSTMRKLVRHLETPEPSGLLLTTNQGHEMGFQIQPFLSSPDKVCNQYVKWKHAQRIRRHPVNVETGFSSSTTLFFSTRLTE